MKIAIISKGSSIHHLVDPQFKSTDYIGVYDTDTDQCMFKLNEKNMNSVQRAGIQTAQNIVQTRAKVLLTGHCEPKAFYVLHYEEIKVFIGADKTVALAIEDYRRGKLQEAKSADIEGY